MIERDYIMRMINLLTQFLARALFHRKAYEFPQARHELEAAYKSLLGLSPSFVREFSDEQIIGMFGRDEDTLVLKSYILGSLIKEEGEILLLEGKGEEGSRDFLRSLSLLLTAFVVAEDEAQEGHCSAIEELLERLREVELPLHVKEKLLVYDELRGEYSKAEDVLFELVESEQSWVRSGLGFYERLLKRTDEELAAGGLPRTEVLEGMEDLKKRET